MATRWDRLTPAARFWRKVDRSGACWEWQGGRMRHGYGVFAIVDGVFTGAHRAAWALTRGAIPLGMWVCHHCDNRQCVRPSHLFLGNALLNVRDMDAKGRRVTVRGEAKPGAKLSRATVATIRAEYVRGYNRFRPGNGPALAATYGVDLSVISRVVNGKAWL